jgi:hypothetical protein
LDSQFLNFLYSRYCAKGWRKKRNRFKNRRLRKRMEGKIFFFPLATPMSMAVATSLGDCIGNAFGISVPAASKKEVAVAIGNTRVNQSPARSAQSDSALGGLLL